MIPETDPHQSPRVIEAQRTNRFAHAGLVIAVLTLVAVVIIGIVSVYAYPKIVSADNTANQVARGNDVASCRSIARQPYEESLQHLEDARTELIKMQTQGLIAVSAGDEGALAQIVRDITSQIDTTDTAREGMDQARETYSGWVSFSKEHPDQFLAKCNEDPDSLGAPAP